MCWPRAEEMHPEPTLSIPTLLREESGVETNAGLQRLKAPGS